jgi:glycosyltransferase involved in cell wall biosynthesis
MEKRKPWIVHIGTYPPYQDGIATFTEHILKAQELIIEDRVDFKVAAIEIMKAKKYPAEVEWIIEKSNKSDYFKVARQINRTPEISAIFLQHEYGIFGGVWGSYINEFLKRVKKPVTTIFHTVQNNPKKIVKKVTQEIIDNSTSIIVLTEHSKEQLLNNYRIKSQKIEVIPHGIHPVVFESPGTVKRKLGMEGKLITGTFGFLSPSKGIEYVLNALPAVFEKFPQAEYWLMGRTHPLVKKKFGESYRKSLIELTKKLGIEKNVRFVDKFMSVEEELEFLSLVDIYIVTSLNPEQTVSGTLSYALGTGRCVISTNFAQAREVIKKDMGMLIDFKNPEAYARAMIHLLGRPKLRSKMHWTAFENTRQMIFPNVALSYLSVAAKNNPALGKEEILLPDLKFDHLTNMTDDFGMIQFAVQTDPLTSSGYTVDDNARALIACVNYLQFNENEHILKLVETYLNYIEICQVDSGFINYIGEDKKQDKLRNSRENLEDAKARTLWALGEVMDSNLPRELRVKAFKIWKKVKVAKIKFVFLRSKAFLIKALYCCYGSDFFANKKQVLAKRIAKEADYLCYVYNKHVSSDHEWEWFEHVMTYSNALLPEALILAFDIVEKEVYFNIGTAALEFLITTSYRDSLCIPIGNGWYEKEKRRSYFDQQPEEAAALVYALVVTFEISQDVRYRKLAMRALYWFLGNNNLGRPLYDRISGGTRDGLTREGVNLNEGAESTVSYLLARLKTSTLFRKNGRYNRITSF